MDLLHEISSYKESRILSVSKKRLFPDKFGKYKVCYLSDIHHGSKFAVFEPVKDLIRKCLLEHIYVTLGGDLIEGATRNSVGGGVYEQDLEPGEQLFEIRDLLNPLVEKGLLVSNRRGNHEDRFKKEVGIDVSAVLSDLLHIPYLGTGGFDVFRVGNITYNSYYTHGCGGSKYIHTKMKKLRDLSEYVEGYDIFAMGHVHDLLSWIIVKKKLDKKKRKQIEEEKLCLITGHYLSHAMSYADNVLAPGRMGSPIVTLGSEERSFETELFEVK